MKICCGNCGEITDWVYLDQEDTIEVKGGRGLANMVLNCKVCKTSFCDSLCNWMSSSVVERVMSALKTEAEKLMMPRRAVFK